MKVIFICRGNVGRSQMAEALFKKYFPGGEVSSAGTQLSGPEQTIENLLPKTYHVISVMDEEDLDIRKNVRKEIKREMLHGVDHIILTLDENDPIQDFLIFFRNKKRASVFYNSTTTILLVLPGVPKG